MDILNALLGLKPQNALAEAMPPPSPLNAMRDPLFWKDINSRIAGALRGGLADVLPTGAGPIVSRNMGVPADPNYFNKMMDAGLAGLTVYHGSPYKFDKFDMSKVGTGEGAQAYGHGLYFAENPGVAKGYKNKLAKNEVFLDGEKVTHNRSDLTPQSMGLNALQMEPNPESAAKALRNAVADESLWQRGSQYDHRQQYAAAANWLEQNAKRIQVDSGAFYRVDLPDDQIAKMLDWDKPLSQQAPEVLNALSQMKNVRHGSAGWSLGDTAETIAAAKRHGIQHLLDDPKINIDGNAVLQVLGGSIGKPSVEATELLRKAGIPGIRYLDQGSRGAGKGTSNFVVFDDNLPKILGRE